MRTQWRLKSAQFDQCSLSGWRNFAYLTIQNAPDEDSDQTAQLRWVRHIWIFTVISEDIFLGPVVQSIVSLTSSLRVISLTVLADSIYNNLIFFAEKMWVAFALQKLLTFFQQKISTYLHITQLKF